MLCSTIAATAGAAVEASKFSIRPTPPAEELGDFEQIFGIPPPEETSTDEGKL